MAERSDDYFTGDLECSLKAIHTDASFYFKKSNTILFQVPIKKHTR